MILDARKSPPFTMIGLVSKMLDGMNVGDVAVVNDIINRNGESIHFGRLQSLISYVQAPRKFATKSTHNHSKLNITRLA